MTGLARKFQVFGLISGVSASVGFLAGRTTAGCGVSTAATCGRCSTAQEVVRWVSIGSSVQEVVGLGLEQGFDGFALIHRLVSLFDVVQRER